MRSRLTIYDVYCIVRVVYQRKYDKYEQKVHSYHNLFHFAYFITTLYYNGNIALKEVPAQSFRTFQRNRIVV